MKDFTGKTALITGGNGGIGLAIAEGLGKAGADIAIWGRTPEKNDSALATLCDQGITAHAYVVDVGDETSVSDSFTQTIAEQNSVGYFLSLIGDERIFVLH